MANQHFIKPLLPGFHSHLTIPVAFFVNNMDRNNEQKTVELRSDASKTTWQVKIEDGPKLTDGWKEFALAHDLRIGDIVIFRQEKDMGFHVTLFGPSCCEIEYESCLEDNEVVSRSTEASSSKSQNRFVTVTLTPSAIKDSRLFLPLLFTRMNGINEDTKMILLDKYGVIWSTKLQFEKRSKRIRLVGGWKDFFKANGVKTGESIMLELIWEEDAVCVLKFCSKVKPETIAGKQREI